MIAPLPKASVVIGETLAGVVLVLVAVLVLTLLIRAFESVVERMERDHDRPLLLVCEESPESIGDILQRLRARARGLLETLARRLRPSTSKVAVEPPADGDKRARSGLRSDDAEARGEERERSAAFEVRPALAGEWLEVPADDGPTGAAAGRDLSSESVSHIENMERESAGGNGA